MRQDGTGSGALSAALRTVARRRAMELAFAELMEGAGYAEVAVPLLQPSDSSDWGLAYRVVDHQGTVLELRPDMTGPVARLYAQGDAGGPRPRRLYYVATLFRRDAGGPREVTQIGAERLGSVGEGPEERCAGDAEVLRLAVAAASAAGPAGATVTLAVGHAGYVAEVLAAVAADTGGRAAAAAAACLRRQDRVGAASALADWPAASQALLWRGGPEAAIAGGIRREGPAADEFLGLLAALQRERLAADLLVEPGLLLTGRYYTGTVFEVVVAGAAAVAGDGGRYDGLLSRWGSGGPAVGFALDGDVLRSASERPVTAGGAVGAVPAGDGALRMALPRGRPWAALRPLLAAAGVPGAATADPDARLWQAQGEHVLYFTRPADVVTYVREGVADVGVTGKDVLLEDGEDTVELMELPVGAWRLSVAVPEAADWPGLLGARGAALRVATSYPTATRDHFAARGVQPHIVRLRGAVELAPLVGLADAVVDMVETGGTLAAHGLREVETVASVTLRLIANRGSYRWRASAVDALCAALARALRL